MKHIKLYEQFINESEVHYFGPSIEDEKKAAQAVGAMSLKPWKDGNAFKRQLKMYFLKDKINQISSGRVTITPGNWKRLEFKTSKKDFNLDQIMDLWKADLERFGKVHFEARNIRIEEFTPGNFVLTF